jgi:hypothetical protein
LEGTVYTPAGPLALVFERDCRSFEVFHLLDATSQLLVAKRLNLLAREVANTRLAALVAGPEASVLLNKPVPEAKSSAPKEYIRCNHH